MCLPPSLSTEATSSSSKYITLLVCSITALKVEEEKEGSRKREEGSRERRKGQGREGRVEGEKEGLRERRRG